MSIRIEYIPHHRINRALWNAALQQCPNRLVYARTVFLDALCAPWDALVAGYYEYLMPLPRRRKFGFRYLPDIPFVQQLGIFSAHPLTKEITTAFLTEAKKRFAYGNIYLNAGNPVNEPEAEPLNNYVLPLNRAYNEIAEGYTADLRYDLRTATKQELEYITEPAATDALNDFRLHYGHKLPHITPAVYAGFEKLCGEFAGNGKLVVRAVKYRGNIVARVVLPEDEKRLYNLLSVNTNEGRKLNANHFLYDKLVQEFSGSDYLLDFEGSDIPGIAFFYRHFGAENTPYHRIHLNRLPWPLNRVKK